MIRLRIKEMLEKKGMSQARLSRLSDVSINTIQDLLKDPSRDVKISTLDRIAKALDVEIEELYIREW
jgi:transcriptional regulator with XRE-family HTH domain